MAEKAITGAQAQIEDQYVTAIIVTHDGVTWLPEVVAALSVQKHQPDEIVAVDNGSKDGSIKLLSNAGISVIKQSRTAGFGSAVAAAVAKLPPFITESGEQEWLWILHDDCAPDRYALAKLLDAVVQRPQVGIAGPKILGWYDRKHILEAGISITENGTRWSGLEKREHDQGQYDEVIDVLAVSTAGMLIKRSLFEDLGGFDPSLELFRDDIDLGWRAHIAGYSVVCVGEAVLYHAQASSSERRSIDVKDAILHRPLLLDRRNAAFVLLANSSWWILPWVAIQLLVTSLGRSIIYLLAKLPGYAGDEIAAIALLIFKPADLIKSRRYRRSNRVLSARVIKPFIPPRGVQVRSILERISSSLLNAFKSNKNELDITRARNYSDIGVIDESFDEMEYESVKKFSRLRALVKQPFLFGFLLTFTFAIIYSRNRFGSLSGGALPISPDSGMKLIQSFAESWHLIGLGSNDATPAWIPIIGVASAITAGNPQLFIALLFFLTPTLLFVITYLTFRHHSISKYSATFASFLYAFSPAVMTAINQGRLGTIVVAIILPMLLALQGRDFGLLTVRWRKIFGISLLAALATTFSPVFLFSWLLLHSFIFLNNYLTTLARNKITWREIFNNLNNDEVKKRFTLFITPILMNVPLSLSFFLHPISRLKEPGLSVASGDQISTLLFNPGGESAPAIFIAAPFVIYLLIGLISSKYRKPAALALMAIALAATLSSYYIVGNSSAAERIWVGPLIIFSQLIILFFTFTMADNLMPQLRRSNFGYKHIVSAFTVIVTAISIIILPLWAITVGANSLVRTDQEQVIPAFITDLGTTSAKPKTLVIRKGSEQLKYFITRGGDLQLGDPDIGGTTPDLVHTAIVELVNGIGATSSQVLGFYGIQYVFMKNPVDAAFVRTVDGIGGYTRSSATKDGVVWKVNNSHARVTYQSNLGQYFGLDSTERTSSAFIPGSGSVVLAEKYDSNWQLLKDGKIIKLEKNQFGQPIFKINEPGEISLTHDGTARRAWISLQLIAILVVIVLALPAGRRRREVPLEELV